MAVTALKSITNANLWDAIRAKYPQFKSHTSKATAELFTANGFESMKTYEPDTLNEFFNLSIRVYLQLVNISHAKDTLEEQGFGEHYDQPYGGIIQRMATNSVKPISAGWVGVKDGDSVDPFVVRKPDVKERFFKQNFDYASLITIPDEYAMKQIFVSEFGMSEFMAGIMAGLENGYTTQVYLNKLEALNAAINSSEYPLQDTQKLVVTFKDPNAPTADELTSFILAVKNAVSAMNLAPQSNAYNAMKWTSTQDVSRLKLLVRAGYKNEVSVRLLTAAFNPENLNLPVDVIEVPNFGGLLPFKEAGFTTPLYPAYNKLGECIGFNTAQGQSTATVTEDKVFWKDPNAGVYAVLADKGLLFDSRQNPYTVEPIRNPRGLYTNYWASSPNNAICVDPLYNMVTFNNAASLPA